MKLEGHPEDLEIVNIVFRSAHTLKGMAGAMHFEHMAHLTHEMESVLDELRNGQFKVTESVINALFESLDVLEQQLDSIKESGTDGEVSIDHAIGLIHQLSLGSDQDAEKRVSTDESSSGPTFDDATKLLIQHAIEADKHVFQIEAVVHPDSSMPSVRGFMLKRAYEEMGEVLWSDPADPASEEFSGRINLVVATHADRGAAREIGYGILEVQTVSVTAIEQMTPEAESTADTATSKVAQSTSAKHYQTKSIRVDVDRLDTLMTLYSEFVIDKTRLEMISRATDHAELHDAVEHLSQVGASFQDIIMKIRMVPLETVFNRFPRMVRDLSKALNKKVSFEISGEDTEIDRAIADEIADPLVHILRNSMDHGLETPESRLASGKSEVGSLRLSAYQAGNHVFIEIEDDGRGINRDKVLNKAVQQGIVQQSEASSLTDEKVYALLFESGLSTAEQVSDISGRGVGLDAVQSKIQLLSGDILVRSNPGKGSTFVIRLPLTVSILFAMLVSVGDETFAIPTNSIVYMDKLQLDSINSTQGQTVWEYRGAWIPLIYLKEAIAVPGVTPRDDLHVAVLSIGDKHLALVVDDFIGQQEVVLKSLGTYVNSVTYGVSGATILGDGQVALILDPNSFIH